MFIEASHISKLQLELNNGLNKMKHTAPKGIKNTFLKIFYNKLAIVLILISLVDLTTVTLYPSNI